MEREREKERERLLLFIDLRIEKTLKVFPPMVQ